MPKKTSTFRELSPEELKDKAVALKKELMQLRFQKKTGKLERQSAIKEVKRNIARILTILNESKRDEKKS